MVEVPESHSRSTSAPAALSTAVRRGVRSLVLLLWVTRLDAQGAGGLPAAGAAVRPEDLFVGGASERYLKAVSVLQPHRGSSWTMRGASTDLPATDSGPWALDRTSNRLRVRGGLLGLSWSSLLPMPWQAGPTWSGRDRKSTRLNSSHAITSRMPSSA